MTKVIEKKVYTSYFDKILSGEKTFELRLADWDCETGDILELIDVDDETKQPTGRSVQRTVGSVVRTKDVDSWTQEDIEKYGYQVISLLETSA